MVVSLRQENRMGTFSHPEKMIEGLEEILINFVWDMYTADDRDWGGPGLGFESDEEPYDYYWEDSRLELMEENWDIFHDMPIKSEPIPRQEIDQNFENLNIVDICKFDGANYQIVYDLTDWDHVNGFPPPGEGFSRYTRRVQLGNFPSLSDRNFDFQYSQVIPVAVVRYRPGGELRSCNSNELYLWSGSHSYLWARRGVG